MQANVMDDRGTGAMKTHFSGMEKLVMRQTRRGCVQECLGCEALTEFKYFKGNEEIFQSLEDAGCFCRMCCTPIHPYKTVIKEKATDAEIITVERPLKCCFTSCKCCSYQEATVTSGGASLGSIHETCWYCVPTMKVLDGDGNDLYLVYPPTCCGGCCVNCCAEGNPCGRGCCKTSHRIYAPDDTKASSKDPYLGVVLKRPKSALTEMFTDAVVLDVEFPKNATPSQKGLITGLALYINSVFYEGGDE